jgi:hypothetical protein
METESLTQRQIEFLNLFAHGEKTMRAIADDMRLSVREVNGWRREPAFAEALEDVHQWLAFQRESDARMGAAEHMRRSRSFVLRRTFLNERERKQGNFLCVYARQLDKSLFKKALDARSGRFDATRVSPVHPKWSREQVHALIERMDRLRNRDLDPGEDARRRDAGD